MTAAVRIELDDEQLDALAERIAAKLRAPRPRQKPAPAPSRKPTPAEVERMQKLMRRRGMR